ncbi:GTP pyrophosphokinase [Krasilnikovia cinnamomea]|uniref:GTP pyrophosphokinase n=1 Tax=Krasilnikovia cinnamomea TaxID=349313 RepID=A0A4Q7ZFE1_9ACTN|nr:GTP pyrophosphokinase [Krasilnikovia cinnamomea]
MSSDVAPPVKGAVQPTDSSPPGADAQAVAAADSARPGASQAAGDATNPGAAPVADLAQPNGGPPVVEGPTRSRSGNRPADPAPPAGDRPSKASPKAAPPKAEPPKAEPPKAEPPKAEPPKAEPPKAEPQAAPAKGGPQAAPAKSQATKAAPSKGEVTKAPSPQAEPHAAPAKGQAAKTASPKGEASPGEASPGEASPGEASPGEASRGEAPKAAVSKTAASKTAPPAASPKAETSKGKTPTGQTAKGGDASKGEATARAARTGATTVRPGAPSRPASSGRPTTTARPSGPDPDATQPLAPADDPSAPLGALASAPTGRRVRARLARFNAPWQSTQVSEVLEPLIATHRASHPKADIRALQRAFDVAARWHSGQYRKSGDPYITHPLAVATILANLGMDTTTLVAALLHDTIEDTAYSLEQMKADFGPEVALLVDGVTKLDRVKLGDAAKAETIRKMVVAMAKDPRVLVIKLADRLHNMRTLTFLPRAKQEQKAKETLEILAPLAHRLGMNTIKWELEDLAFGTLFPKRFEEINRLIGEHQPQREALLRQVTQRVQLDLKSAKIKAEVTGRPKHLYSIYQKMIVRGRDFNDIYDLVGVRILVDTVRDCYAALGVIHANWQPVPGRFKDYIAMPKFNMYQSLHTTVIGPTGKPVEMQIRTFAMHRTAEFGIAAHWKYKEQKGATIVGPPAHIDEMTWLRQLLDWQREASDPSEFLDALRFDLSSQEVYVFTPKGDVIPLPTGSTPVDFAYAVHTEVGHKCIGARVNGKLVPLESTLSNGDVIEIFTSKSSSAGPTQDWLGFVKSPRARTKIRQYFNKERREEAIEVGKEAIVKAMRKQGLPLQRMLTSENLTTIARDLHLADVASLYAAVGENTVSAQSVVQKLVAGFGGEEGAVEDIAETAVATRPPRTRGSAQDPGVVVKGVSDVWVKLARCCTPVPGDTVFGFVTRSGGVSVHREDCANAEDLRMQRERVVEVSWKPTSASTFLVAIQVEALDRHKLLADVTRVLSEERVNILSATVTTTRDRVAVSRFTFEMADPKHLGHLVAAVRKVDGVFDAYRVTSGA